MPVRKIVKIDETTRIHMPNKQSSVLILGAGSIGTTVGLKLKKQGHHVVLGRRRVPFGKKIKINLIGKEELSENIEIIEIDNIGEMINDIQFDLIIITSQRQQLQKLLIQTQAILKSHQDTPVLCLLNGKDVDKVICDTLKMNTKIILGSVWWSATLIDSQNIYYHNTATTTIGISKINCSSASKFDLEKVSKLLSNEFEISISNDIENEIRKKLMLNVVSPILAYVKKPYPTGLNDLRVRNVIHLLYDEALYIAKSLEWDIEDERLNKFHKIIASSDFLDHSSLHENLPTHKVSTQISAEKYGGKGSNAREILELFVNNGGEKISFVLNEIEKLPSNYTSKKIDFIESKLLKLKIHRCTLID